MRGKLARSYRRGWNAALRTLAFALDDDDFGEDESLSKRTVARTCKKVRFRRDEVRTKTNHELAAFYGCSCRTIQYWRKEGAPLERGGAAMLRWLAGRPQLPKGTEERFGDWLEMERIRVGVRRLKAEAERCWASLGVSNPPYPL